MLFPAIVPHPACGYSSARALNVPLLCHGQQPSYNFEYLRPTHFLAMQWSHTSPQSIKKNWACKHATLLPRRDWLVLLFFPLSFMLSVFLIQPYKIKAQPQLTQRLISMIGQKYCIGQMPRCSAVRSLARYVMPVVYYVLCIMISWVLILRFSKLHCAVSCRRQSNLILYWMLNSHLREGHLLDPEGGGWILGSKNFVWKKFVWGILRNDFNFLKILTKSIPMMLTPIFKIFGALCYHKNIRH